ncbi:MAG: hypothetical protein JWN98_1574 [Abditibacteriota bacterium]|nr:hypothetical protein [Abditibacteriota bacterium]
MMPFSLDTVQSTFELIKEIYAAAGVPQNCRLVIGEEDHRFYAQHSWSLFHKLSGW